MTDLLHILPSFPISAFAALIPTIEQHALTTTDLLTIHPTDLAKQTHLPIIDLRRFLAAIQASLSDDLVSTRLFEVTKTSSPSPPLSTGPERKEGPPSLKLTPSDSFISTLDDGLDNALGGGVPVGCITEFAGESGVGKTQFLLSLCLAVQLQPPHGLGKQALYISTESGLTTRRLAQMMAGNSILKEAAAAGTPVSLDNIHSAVTPDLESQDHILEYQVPVLISRHRIGLLIIDSVAANYRAEFERQGSLGSNMATRGAELVRLGALLRDLARNQKLAIVVANQVADRFASSTPSFPRTMALQGNNSVPQSHLESPLASRSMPPPTTNASISITPSSSMLFPSSFQAGASPTSPALALDHQQRWFTGWGDDPHSPHSLKTPSLGLVWSTQISCRVVLFKRPLYGRTRRTAAPIQADDYDDIADNSGAQTLKSWRRWMKVVFAPHVAASGQGVDGAIEYEITMAGVKSIQGREKDAKS